MTKQSGDSRQVTDSRAAQSATIHQFPHHLVLHWFSKQHGVVINLAHERAMRTQLRTRRLKAPGGHNA